MAQHSPNVHDYHRSVGLPTDWLAITHLIDHSKVQQAGLPHDYNFLLAYSDPAGFTISFCTTQDNEAIDNIVVTGQPLHTVEAWQIRTGLAHIGVLNEEGELSHRVLALVDDPHRYPAYTPDVNLSPKTHTGYRLGALAVDMSLSPSITEWEAKTKPINEEGQRLGPKFLVSPWLFDLYSSAATAEEMNSMAHMVAVIDSVEVATTAMTGERWYRCQV